MALDPDRLFPLDASARRLAREIYETVSDLPIISPHGHTDPVGLRKTIASPIQHSCSSRRITTFSGCSTRRVFRLNPWACPASTAGRRRPTGARSGGSLRPTIIFSCDLSKMWIDHSFEYVFGLDRELSESTADAFYDHITDCLSKDEFRPRQLFDRFGIEVLSTTESAIDPLNWHKIIQKSDWSGRVITAYRPDNVIDPEFEDFARNVAVLGELTGEDTTSWQGYLSAHRDRRAFFKAHGATSSDHGHPTARTECLSQDEVAALYAKALAGECTPEGADAFRGHMLTEMARMSLDDGLVLQIHPGSFRNHSASIMAQFGRDKGFDIPTRIDFVRALRPCWTKSEPIHV